MFVLVSMERQILDACSFGSHQQVSLPWCDQQYKHMLAAYAQQPTYRFAVETTNTSLVEFGF